MKDLEKMKSEFERKYKLAEIGNQLEERFGCEFMVIDRSKEQGARFIAETDDIHIVGDLLKAFPADKEQALNATAGEPKGTIFGLYHVYANRGFRDLYTKLQIKWLNGNNEYQCELIIDENEVLEPFFVNDQRKMSRIECDTYKPMRRGHIVRDLDLPIKRFLCNQIRYEGGYQSATEPERIEEIINAIKEA